MIPLFPRHGGSSDSSSMEDMDMDSSSSSSNSTSTMESMMKPYLHFTKGDVVLFSTITPTSAGEIFGACLIFFLFAVLSRYVNAVKRGIEVRCGLRSKTLLQRHSTSDGEEVKTVPLPQSRFVLSHELARSGIVGVEVFMHYLLMLIAMTFNAAYITSIILGAVVGEFAFGRLNRD